MEKIMFICQGNICRSPMAMFYLRYRLKTLGLENEYQVTSAALEISTKGYDMEKKAQDELIKNNIPFEKHSAHQLNPKEFLQQDYVLYMESFQKIQISRLMSNHGMERTHLLYEYTGIKKNIDDPYFTDDFDTAFQEIRKAVDAFIEKEIIGKETK